MARFAVVAALLALSGVMVATQDVAQLLTAGSCENIACAKAVSLPADCCRADYISTLAQVRSALFEWPVEQHCTDHGSFDVVVWVGCGWWEESPMEGSLVWGLGRSCRGWPQPERGHNARAPRSERAYRSHLSTRYKDNNSFTHCRASARRWRCCTTTRPSCARTSARSTCWAPSRVRKAAFAVTFAYQARMFCRGSC